MKWQKNWQNLGKAAKWVKQVAKKGLKWHLWFKVATRSGQKRVIHGINEFKAATRGGKNLWKKLSLIFGKQGKIVQRAYSVTKSTNTRF